jgi:hypothetical protein
MVQKFSGMNPNISEIYSYSSLLQNGKPVTTPDGKQYVVSFNKDKKLELNPFIQSPAEEALPKEAMPVVTQHSAGEIPPTAKAAVTPATVNRPKGSFPRNNAFHQKDKIPRSKAFYKDKTMPTDYRPGSPVTPPSPEVAEAPVKSVSQAGVEVKTTRPPESDDSSFLEQNPMRETLPGSSSGEIKDVSASSGEVKPTPAEVKKASSVEQVSRTGLSSLLQTGKQLSLTPTESAAVAAAKPPREMTIIKGKDPQKRYEAALKAAVEEQRQVAKSLDKRKM